MTDRERDFYTQHIRERLGDYRFKHSVNVSKEAVRLAKLYGCDEEKAELAGLLHDVMKDAGKKEQLDIIEKYGVKLNEVEQHVFIEVDMMYSDALKEVSGDIEGLLCCDSVEQLAEP